MKNKRIALFCVVLLVCAGSPVFSQTPVPDFSLKDLQASVDEFATNLAYSLPFNSSMGLVWSDAYIGKFPHFGAGVSVGFTTLDLGSFTEVFDLFSIYLPAFLSGFGGFPIPGYTVEARLGGFVLPFDMGFKFGYLPISPGTLETFDYLLVGYDVRYALLEGKGILPVVSVGVGFNYMKGALGVKAGEDQHFDYYTDPLDPAGSAQVLTLKTPLITLPWETASLDFKAQISKSLGILTPYVGIGLSKGWSKAGYIVETGIESNDPTFEDTKGIIKKLFGIDDMDDTGFESMVEVPDKWSGRLYGGFSINLIKVVKFDFTGYWNFWDNKYGVSVGGRLQF